MQSHDEKRNHLVWYICILFVYVRRNILHELILDISAVQFDNVKNSSGEFMEICKSAKISTYLYTIYISGIC